MIIDLILDRLEGQKYSAREFYFNVLQYGEIGNEITRAMDCGTENEVRTALCNYIRDNEYKESLCDQINRLNWIED